MDAVPLAESTVDAWNALIDKTADSQARAATLQRGAEELGRTLALHDDYGGSVLAALVPILDEPRITPEAWNMIDQALTLSLGVESTRLITWLVSNN